MRSSRGADGRMVFAFFKPLNTVGNHVFGSRVMLKMNGNAMADVLYGERVPQRKLKVIVSNGQESLMEDVYMVFGLLPSNMPCLHTATKVNFRYRYEILMKALSKSNASCAHFSKHILKFLCVKWFMMNTTDRISLSVLQCITAQNIFFSSIESIAFTSCRSHVSVTCHVQDSSLKLKRKHTMFKIYAKYAENCLLLHLRVQEIISHHLKNNGLNPIIGSVENITQLECISLHGDCCLRFKIPRGYIDFDVDLMINIVKLQIFTCGQHYYVDLKKFNGSGVLRISKDFRDIHVTSHMDYHAWSCLTTFAGTMGMQKKHIRFTIHSFEAYDCAQTMTNM